MESRLYRFKLECVGLHKIIRQSRSEYETEYLLTLWSTRNDVSII